MTCLRFGLPILVCLSLSVTGCVSSMGTFWSGLSPDPARARWSRATKELENPVKLHLSYARWQEEIGQLVEARNSYELVLGAEPKSVDAILGLARLDHLAKTSSGFDFANI